MNKLIELCALWADSGKVSGKGLDMKTAPAEAKEDIRLMIGPAIVGRLWKSEKTDKHGNAYYSGFFLDARCLVFRVAEKRSDKSPDYRVLIAPKDEEQPSNQPEAKQHEEDEELPF